MTSIFSDRDDVRCRHYARFAAHLDRPHFDIIYWVLFILVIFMLFAASWRYGRAIDTVAPDAAGSPEHRREMKRCMVACGVYAVVSVVAVVMEVFALMALQFCDGEDLMALYWSTWTVMQIGSLIAIFGILLAVSHTIRGRKHPPWALALGTPVLVVAGLGHIIQAAMHKKVKSVRSGASIYRQRSNRSIPDNPIPAAEESGSDEAEFSCKAKLLGYTPDGSPILQFGPRETSFFSPQPPLSAPSPAPPLSAPSPSSPSPTSRPAAAPTPSLALRLARIVGTDPDGQIIVAFRNGRAAIPVVATSAGTSGGNNNNATATTTNSGKHTRHPPPPPPESDFAARRKGSGSGSGGGGGTATIKLREPLDTRRGASPAPASPPALGRSASPTVVGGGPSAGGGGGGGGGGAASPTAAAG